MIKEFLTGNLFAWIIRVVIVSFFVYLFYAFCTWLISTGYKDCEAKTLNVRVVELEKSKEENRKLKEENIQNRLEYEAKLAANDIQNEKDLKDAKDQYDRDVYDLKHNGVRVPIKEGSCTVTNTNSSGVSNTTGNTSGFAGTSSAELQADFSEEVYSDYARADILAIRFNKALAELKADRETCKPSIKVTE